MKKQLVDYSGFTLRKLNDPRFSHIKLLGGWIAYFILYFVTENLIPVERCHPIHCALDDVIPLMSFLSFFMSDGFFLLQVLWRIRCFMMCRGLKSFRFFS